MKILLIVLAVFAAGCARNDEGDLWKYVKHCNEGKCK